MGRQFQGSTWGPYSREAQLDVSLSREGAGLKRMRSSGKDRAF